MAQGAHASVGAIFSIGQIDESGENLVIPLKDPFVKAWVMGRFKKITLSVDNDEDLLKIHEKAIAAGLPCALIRDAGLTEFNGIPTLTAVGIGPGNPELIDAITGDLSLF